MAFSRVDIILLFILIVHWLAGVCLTLRSFECAIQPFCADVISIDPRIQTPSSQPPSSVETCPIGTTRCVNVKCGIAVAQPSLNDGDANIQAFPWHAFLESNGAYIGGGVLIHQYFVLTAAHKVCNVTRTSIKVKMGVRNGANPNIYDQISDVIYTYVPSSYDSAHLKNDVALLFLNQPMNFDSFVNKVCLPSPSIVYDNYPTRCIVTGFGQINFTSGAAPTTFLKQVHVPITNNPTCRNSLSTVLGNVANVDNFLDNNDICAGGENQKDACTQDGGSPLVCPTPANSQVYSVVGLVIWGKNCGTPGVYGVYLRVQSFLANINGIIACALTNPNPAACAIWGVSPNCLIG